MIKKLFKSKALKKNKVEKHLKKISIISAIVFGIIGLISFFIIPLNVTYHLGETNTFNEERAARFGDFFGGFVGTIFSILSVLLLIYSIFRQYLDIQKSQVENNFFRMIDYHNQNVNQLKIPNLDSTKNDISEGRRGFVPFKIQIHKLFAVVREINIEQSLNLSNKKIADIVYMIFYYGIDGSWINFIEKKLSRYKKNKLIASEIQAKINLNPTLKIDRTNQTNLSTYFRNMYNAIKLVDESKFLSKQEKENLIKIYRAQLSNPELYVLFFNVMSRFGKKWIENNYLIKYEFVKNLPKNYCDGYKPNKYFPMQYEDDEY